jgi:hypothetical protein
MLVGEALGALEGAKRQVQQTERKTELITMGQMALEILLEQCPAYLVLLC